MISLRNELERETEMKRSEDLRLLVAKEYAQAIRTMADYAIEFDPRTVAEFRTHLRNLQMQAETASSATDYFEVQASLRGELRRYRDQSNDQIARIRGEMANAAAAMQAMAESVTGSSADLETQVRSEITRLETAAASNDLATVQKGILEATSGLRESYEQLQKSTHLTIAQLQDELHALHREINEERRALYTDKESSAWIRQKVDERINDLLRQGEVFWVLFIRWDMKGEEQPTTFVIETVLRAIVRRTEVLLGKDAIVGRWSQELLAAIVEIDPATRDEVTKEIRAKLSGMYAVQEDGRNHSVCVAVQFGAVECPRGTKPIELLPRLGQASGALSGRVC